jgi:dihydroneopterin aldolase
MADDGTSGSDATLEGPGAAPAPGAAHEITLDVEAIRLDVRLGCTAAERAAPQGVEVKVTIRFPLLPAACWTDRLEDTMCYAELVALAREHCAGREFRLVERLALELYGLVHERLPHGARLSLAVTKLSPPVAEIERGVRFTIADR